MGYVWVMCGLCVGYGLWVMGYVVGVRDGHLVMEDQCWTGAEGQYRVLPDAEGFAYGPILDMPSTLPDDNSQNLTLACET